MKQRHMKTMAVCLFVCLCVCVFVLWVVVCCVSGVCGVSVLRVGVWGFVGAWCCVSGVRGVSVLRGGCGGLVCSWCACACVLCACLCFLCPSLFCMFFCVHNWPLYGDKKRCQHICMEIKNDDLFFYKKVVCKKIGDRKLNF